MSISDDTSLSSMEGPQTMRIRVPLRRIARKRKNPLVYLSDNQFKERYSFSKETVRFIFGKIQNKLRQARIKRRDCISPMLQLLIALRFYATGSFQSVIADTANVSKATVCRVIEQISKALAMQRQEYVKMPSAEEQPRVAEGFFDIAGFPQVIGAVDCTHIKINSPGGNRAELYRNRKGYFSINVQAICDSNLKIRSIIARWPGSTHNTNIWNNSPLAAHFESGSFGSYLLLGDSGYPCLRYLMTPFLNPATSAEEAYNRAQISTWNTIERCFGVLKRRFPCLHTGMQLRLPKVYKVIIACVVLHNMTLELEDHTVEMVELCESNDIEVPEAQAQNFALRSALVEGYFYHYIR